MTAFFITLSVLQPRVETVGVGPNKDRVDLWARGTGTKHFYNHACTGNHLTPSTEPCNPGYHLYYRLDLESRFYTCTPI